MPLTGVTGEARRGLGLYDVVYVNVVEPKVVATKNTAGKSNSKSRDAKKSAQNGDAKNKTPRPEPAIAVAGQAQLRVRPTVEGATLVLENKTGRILAMAGGFSYPMSQLNRVTQTQRQPGSAMKPLTYLTALAAWPAAEHAGAQSADHLPADRHGLDGRDAISRQYDGRMRPEDYWSPRNADFSEGGVFTHAPRAGEFDQYRHRASSRRRHRWRSGTKSRRCLRYSGRGENLQPMRALLPLRARRAAGADDRFGGVLCRRRQ